MPFQSYSGRFGLGTLAGIRSLSLTSGGGTDAFVTKYDTNGTIQWAARIGGTNGDEDAYGTTTDSSGNVYVIGSYTSDTITIFNANGNSFGTLDGVGSSDVFIVKYNTSGTAQWVTRITGPLSPDVGYGIASDSSGNVYVTGSYTSDTITIFNAGGTSFGTLTCLGSNDVFIVKYNTSGTAQWSARIAGNSTDIGYGIATDSSGNVYVCGYYASAPVTIYNSGGGTFGTLEDGPSAGAAKGFVVKYNTSGTAQWASRIVVSGTTGARIHSIAVDTSGNVYVTGYGNGASLYNGTGTLFGTLTAYGGVDLFVAKYNTTGTVQWGAVIGGGGGDQGYGIAVDGSGNVYVTGFYQFSSSPVPTVYNANGTSFGTLLNPSNTNIFVVKYNTSGAAQWSAVITADSNDRGTSITTDSSGNIYVTGFFQPNTTIYNANGTSFGTLTRGVGYSSFIVKYNTSGAVQWATRLVGTNSVFGRGISSDSSANVYGVGGFYSTLTLYSKGF